MEANPQGATYHSAASRLSQLLQSEQTPTEEQSGEEQEAQVTQEVPTDEEETQETEPQGDPEPEVETFKVKVNGEEVEVTLEDMKKGYMMESDYRQKTSKLSEQRERLEAREAELNGRLDDAKVLIDVDMERLNSPEMQELKTDDPEAYLKEYDKLQKRVEKFNQLQAKHQNELNAKKENLLAKERDLLFTAFPEWKHDEQAMQREAAELLGVLKNSGYSQQELETLTDHRMFELAKKAKMLDDIQAKTLKEKEKKATPTKNMRPGATPEKIDAKSEAQKKMRAKLKKSGRWEDALALLKTS